MYFQYESVPNGLEYVLSGNPFLKLSVNLWETVPICTASRPLLYRHDFFLLAKCTFSACKFKIIGFLSEAAIRLIFFEALKRRTSPSVLYEVT